MTMTNFFTDNQDIQFLFDHMDIARLAAIMEEDFRFTEEFEHAPRDAEEAVDNYRRILATVGELTAERIAPTAEETDRIGNILNDDGTVTYTPGIADAVKSLSQAGVMGFTLPHRFGGLNCPNLVYTMAIDIVSRADASLMNLFGLQGIGETINAFADEDIRQAYLPDMASGKASGAMVLTEPDAGSDLQAVKVKAWQDDAGRWYINGVKRFITNGCGDVLLVLARSEPDIADGRGLSLFLADKGPKVKVRRIENKLGIHGSPTCELVFEDTPAKLIGERQQGLIKYVMALMYGARMGIAAQSLGIAEAACHAARSYAHSRRQFGATIDAFPAVREMLVDMSVDLQAARALTYYASLCVDVDQGLQRKLASASLDPDEKKKLKSKAREYRKINGLLTPMCKYWASEMCLRVANNAVAVLGGSGYMKDYPVERLTRDARITSIYEGTSQLQIVAAIGGITSGAAETIINQLLDRQWSSDIAPMVDQIRSGVADLADAIAFVKDQPDPNYRRLYARKLVDMAIYLIIGAIFCDHAAESDAKRAVLRRWLAARMPELQMNKQLICSGDDIILSEFETLAGPVPDAD
ncbi:MAG: acyl-CoA dehydrogenase family protein [Phycisphaerales bacterium]|nr:acyl-CoA dehydrogenase family protein [Phycisphaerales bacterium]